MIAEEPIIRQALPAADLPPHPGPEPWLPRTTPTRAQMERWCGWAERRERHLRSLLQQQQEATACP